MVFGFTTDYAYCGYAVHFGTTYEYTIVHLCVPACFLPLLLCVLLYCCWYGCAVLLPAAAAVYCIDSGVSLLFIQPQFIFDVPLGSTATSIYRINAYHTRGASPQRADA